MTNDAITITITAAAAVLLLASTSTARANVEAGEGGASFDLGNLTDTAESFMNQITETAAAVDLDTAGQNIAAFLELLKQSEGTASSGDPYAVCYGYGHTIRNFDDHPAVTGEWTGKTLPPEMCRNAGFGPGCKSTAAGAYQIIKPTWLTVRKALNLPDFGPASQDAAAVELLRRRGALEDVKAGRIAAAIHKSRNEWASLPGNYAGQGQRNINTLFGWYETAGGTFA